MEPMLILGVPVFILIGAVAFVVNGRRRVRRAAAFTRRSVVTTAEVIGLDLRPTYRISTDNLDTHGSHWFPTVRFLLPDGQQLEAETVVGSAPLPPAKVGERVAVRYDPRNPTHVHLDSGLAQPKVIGWMHVALGVGLAGVVLFFGLVLAAMVFVLDVPIFGL